MGAFMFFLLGRFLLVREGYHQGLEEEAAP